MFDLRRAAAADLPHRHHSGGIHRGRDAKGNPVTGLTKEDILVIEKGRPREVAFFRFEGGDIPSRSQPLPLGEFTNRAEFSPGPARNITALVLDALNVPAAGQAARREDLMRFLNVLPRGTRAALYRLGKQVTVLHDFTEDMEALRERVAAGEPEMPRQFASPGLIGGGFNAPRQSGSAEMAASKGEALAAEASRSIP